MKLIVGKINLISLGFILLLSVLFMSCDNKEELVSFLDVSKAQITVNYEGYIIDANLGEKYQPSFEIGCSNSWEVIEKDEWITLNHTSGTHGRSTIFITTTEIGISASRQGSITIKSGEYSHVLSIAQNKKIEELDVSPSLIVLNRAGLIREGGNAGVGISTNSDWQIESSENWLTPSPASGSKGDHLIMLDAEVNNTPDSRSAYLYINSGTLKDSVKVTQNLEGFSISVSEIKANKAGEIENNAETIKLESVTAWSITADSWITVTPSSGSAGTTDVAVSLKENTRDSQREGKITITTTDGIIEEIPVTQSNKLNLYEDDGKAEGYVYLLEDFSWCTTFAGKAGDDQVADPKETFTISINNTGPGKEHCEAAKAAFDARKYYDYKPENNCFYVAQQYVKFNKGGKQTGIIISEIPNLDENKITNIQLTLDAAPNVKVDADYNVTSIEEVDITVEIYQGPGSIDVDDENTKQSDSRRITVSSYNQWDNIGFVLYGVTSETQVLIRSTNQDTDGYYRWFLDNIKFEKHSIVQ
uniref:BACON domain-containing protein n=1 Tax=uncultured Draconibacterium sp. TaxID=1573823 RepID=UPI003216D816